MRLERHRSVARRVTVAVRKRICLALDLQEEPQAIANYDRIHRPGSVWPEVIEDLRRRGYAELTIWRTGNRLFMIAEVDAGASPAGPSDVTAEDPATQAVLERWRELTSTLQRALPGTGPRPEWIEMGCVFDLGEHP